MKSEPKHIPKEDLFVLVFLTFQLRGTFCQMYCIKILVLLHQFNFEIKQVPLYNKLSQLNV